MAVQRRKFSFDAEKQLLINLITNDEYCRTILPLVDDEYLTSKSAGVLIQWVRAYWDAYESAPKSGITAIFENESGSLNDEEKDHIEKVLQHLSDVSFDNEETNTPYLIDKGKEFLRKRHLELRIKAAQHHVSNGELEKAEQALEERFDMPDELDIVRSWNDTEYIRSAISKMSSREDPDSAFFRYRGRLGEFMGNMDAGWLVGLVGPSKRGKTIYLSETAHEGIIRRMNTLVYSLEMPDQQLYIRSMKSLTAATVSPEAYETMVPVFDCELNQNGECPLTIRKGFGSLDNENGVHDTYEDRPEWVVCTACRGSADFHPASWLIPTERKAYNEETYFTKVNSFMRLFGKYGKTIFHPSKTASVETLNSDLYMLEHRFNWVPHIVVLDYADLMVAERGSSQKRFELDDIWEGLRSTAQERKCLLVTASQTNRGGVDSKYVRETDIAEDYSKIAKLDLGIGLCQTETMKAQGLMNLNKVVSRHTNFIQSHTCTCLQELGHMQGMIDSEFRMK